MNLSEFVKSDFSGKPHLLLLGNPVGQSLSPLMHNTASEYYGLDLRYFAIELGENEIGLLATHLNKESFKGANITIPYKEWLLELVDEVESTAETIGAINTIVKEDYRLTGFNTDPYGFTVPLRRYEDRLKGGKAIVFGTGGASKAIAFALTQLLGMESLFLVSRQPGRIKKHFPGDPEIIGYDSWRSHAFEAELLVNATPMGMEPHDDTCPVLSADKQFLADRICYDIVYKPIKTLFLKLAEEAGGIPVGGLEMLIHQGSRSFELWSGKPFPIEKIRQKIYEHIRN